MNLDDFPAPKEGFVQEHQLKPTDSKLVLVTGAAGRPVGAGLRHRLKAAVR